MTNKLKIVIPFKTKTDTGTFYGGTGYIYINNDFIVKQEVKLEYATISTRVGSSKESDAFINYSKKLSLRKELLGDLEFKFDNEETEIKSVALNQSQLKTIENYVNKEGGTILSTLAGLLTYVNATGSDKKVSASPLQISKGKFAWFRFYNIFSNEFSTSKKAKGNIEGFEEILIDDYIESSREIRNMFSLYNFDRDFEYLNKAFGFSKEELKNKTYYELLGDLTRLDNVLKNKNNIEQIIELMRRSYKKKVMDNSSYKFDFVYNDTDKENTEAAHIYEVHKIKQLENSEDWDMIRDVENCLLLTPDVHRAWDKEQIKINNDGTIINISMEEKRFERMFKPSNYRINWPLTAKQKEYLDKRNQISSSI